MEARLETPSRQRKQVLVCQLKRYPARNQSEAWNIYFSCPQLCMVLDAVGREAERKHHCEQIQIQSLSASWLEEQDGCGEKQVWRIQWWRSQSFEENSLEADLEHLRILQGQLAETLEDFSRCITRIFFKSCTETQENKRKVLNPILPSYMNWAPLS